MGKAHLKGGGLHRICLDARQAATQANVLRAEARTHFSSSAAKLTAHDNLGITHLQEKEGDSQLKNWGAENKEVCKDFLDNLR